jgi:DNA-binding SARP family transcriptional activator
VGAHGEQPALVVARLVLDRPSPLPREELADLLWPTNRPVRWEGPARHVVSRARALLVEAGAPTEAVGSRGGRTEFALAETIDVDVEDALRATADAESAVDAANWSDATAHAERALELLRRPFFERSEAVWTRRWQERLRTFLVRALHAGAAGALGDARPADAVLLANESLALDPFDERSTRTLMQAHDALGSRGNALAAFEQCRRHLHEELGVRPSDETEQLYARLTGGESGMRPTGRAGTAPVSALGNRSIVSPSALPFAGRDRELVRLHEDWEATRAGAARAAVIEGEPGIGKTRLTHELTRRAEADGALVLWGTCAADVGLPHQPFADLLAQLLRQRPEVGGRLGALVDDLGALVPDIVTRAPAATIDDFARDRVFRAVAGAFVALDEPVLLVIDDIQWAGLDGLAMLRHVLPAIEHRSWFVVVTARETVGPVAGALADMQERIPTTTIELRGLSIDAVAEVLERSGVRLDGDVQAIAAQVEARTTGNPFYVSQLVGDTSEPDPFDPGAVPDALAHLVARRLDALDPKLTTTLALAAVAGNEFTFATLEACSPLTPEKLIEIVEQFCRMRFLEERETNEFRFVHALVRDAVLGTIGPTRRQQLHRRVVAALADQQVDAAVLAHHHVAAGSTNTDEATLWSLAAGHEALAQAAWSVADDHFTVAAMHASEVDHRCAALVGLGHAKRALGDPHASRDILEEALALGQAHGQRRTAAAATLALVGGGGRGVALNATDAERNALLRAALAGLTDDDLDLRVPVIGELALTLVLTDAEAERTALAERCVADARRLGDTDAIALALQFRRSALMGPAHTVERIADSREILALPGDAVMRERVISAHLGLVEDLLELGDRAGASASLRTATELAELLAHPYWSWATTCWRALDAIIDGDLDRAEQLAHEAFAFQAPSEHPEAVAALGVNLTCIRMFQGRSHEMLELLRGAADANPHIPAYRAVLAQFAASAGDAATADETITSLAASRFAFPPDSNWLLATATVGDAVVLTGRREHAPVLLALLEPYADREVVLNCFGGGGAYWGPVSYTLGRLAALLGETDRAARFMTDAAAATTAFRAPLFAQRVAKTQLALSDQR